MWVSERIMAVREGRLYCQKLSVIGSLSFLVMAVFLSGCASSGAFHQGNDLAEMGDWDVNHIETNGACLECWKLVFGA